MLEGTEKKVFHLFKSVVIAYVRSIFTDRKYWELALNYVFNRNALIRLCIKNGLWGTRQI